MKKPWRSEGLKPGGREYVKRWSCENMSWRLHSFEIFDPLSWFVHFCPKISDLSPFPTLRRAKLVFNNAKEMDAYVKWCQNLPGTIKGERSMGQKGSFGSGSKLCKCFHFSTFRPLLFKLLFDFTLSSYQFSPISSYLMFPPLPVALTIKKWVEDCKIIGWFIVLIWAC